MKKTYSSPEVEVVKFDICDTVTNDGSGFDNTVSCSVNWLGFGDSAVAGCNLTVDVPDSGF